MQPQKPTQILKIFRYLYQPLVIGLIFPGIGILVKSSLCLLTMVLLANTTPFAELLRVLRRVRIPALLVTTLALLYR